MIKKYDLVNFGYNPWSDYWKRNQTIFHLLSIEKYINKSYFVNTPVYIMDLIKKPFKELSQPKINNWKAVFNPNTDKFSGEIITNIIFPYYSKKDRIEKLNKYLFYKRFKKINASKSIVIVNRADTVTRHIVEHCFPAPAIKIFDWSDDFEQFSSNELERKKIRENVEFHISSANVVLCVNENLCERASKINKNSYIVKNATNFFTFTDSPVVADVTVRSGRPIVGYMGWINESRLDIELIRYLACQRPEWDFVFVGPRSHEDALSELKGNYDNVKLVDPVPYTQLPAVLAQFNVCILPNLLNEHTAGNDPIKLFDYLASGKPVVSTNTSGAGYLKDHIDIAHDKEEFLALVGSALESSGGEVERIEHGRMNSWSKRFLEVHHLIKEALAIHEN